METLTKAERHEIYKLALIYYKNQIKDDSNSGMCKPLDQTIIDLKIDYDWEKYDYYYKYLHDLLPEFAKIKPDTIKENEDWFWWDTKNTKIRIKMFKLLIEQTKPDGSEI
jgi:hypothetical protein